VRFCPVCGHATSLRVPSGDNRTRDCCDHCGAVHYVNPRPVVGTIPVWGEQVLLCKRAIEPRYAVDAVRRFHGDRRDDGRRCDPETIEEAGARIELPAFLDDRCSARAAGSHLLPRRPGRYGFHAGRRESRGKALHENETWDEIAFRTVSATLRLFFADRARGEYGTHTQAIIAPEAPVPLARA
jgi:hypothetical protein